MLTIDKMAVIETDTGRSSADITNGDEVVGEIVKEVEDVGCTSHEWRATGYEVTMLDRDGADAYFAVSDHGTARKALAAAKAHVRSLEA